ncbi:TRAP transporter large permease [Pararhodobacter sp. CCB-MM2]|uniref:TRAP transporter large permease n=1 Tax=Pararhodobacter sp. CCB-MM2 TaxID=1786003 RepID=UPI00082FCE08|nr:TRAP transporter large permease [Pararhodobacter sp. CCB-MM2]MCA2013601.1 TRAP transporter large permease [Cereibacter sphaeroides]
MYLFLLPFLGIALAAGAAIAFVIGAGAVLSFVASDNLRYLAVLPQRMFSQLDVFAFLAMPLFILAGDLMNRGGITKALTDLSMLLVGWLRGGLGHVNVLTSVFFAGVSGSAISDAAALGSGLVPEMERRGYTRDYAAAITAASSIIGPIIPPSSILIFYGALMNTSVAALFAAGIVPGLLLAAMLMGMNAFYAHRDNHPRGIDPTAPREPAARVVLRALPALLMPLIILGGTVLGVATPAEAAALAVIVALVVGVSTRHLNAAAIRESLIRSGTLLGAIFLILCAISTFSYLAALLHWPEAVLAVVEGWGLSQTGYLLLINVIFLVAGMVMDVKAAVALLAPIFVPAAVALGVDPVQLGMIICLNITVGLLSPPVGGVLLILGTTVQLDYWRLVRATLPFLIAEIILLFVITYVPALSLALPQWLGLI